MIGRLINLPLKVLGKAAHALQERNDAAMRERHGTGDESDSLDYIGALPEVELPDGFDPASVEQSAQEIRALVRERPPAFVDMRPRPRWLHERVAGAFSMPAGELNLRIAEIPPDTCVVVYADDPARARKGALFCRDRGLDDSWSMRDGLAAWKKAGGALASGED